MITLYTTNCPKCSILKSKLDAKGIKYQIISDMEIMIKKGFSFMPVLEINGKTMEFAEAVKWVNGQGEQK